MESTEISMNMDVKLNINKHGESLRFKRWTRCCVKVEAIKCLPCFLRITFTPDSGTTADDDEQQPPRSLHVSIIVPGVTISLAASRTKQHSYGLFWTQNRRDCFIYFALETETSCRRHMKWIKKAIKNLDQYRQIFLERRQQSRSPVTVMATGEEATAVEASQQEQTPIAGPTQAGETPGKAIDYIDFDGEQDAGGSWSHRVSHISDIYEEIFEGNETPPPRLSRRQSRTSIASGIYEEMKCTTSMFNAIMEEAPEPPPRPPLPSAAAQQRKRINTFESDHMAGLLGEIPRSNTNPECELAKKKKYKNVLEKIFGSGRSKRTKSVSETQVCSAEDVIACHTPQRGGQAVATPPPLYANEAAVVMVARKRQRKPLPKCVLASMADAKRNSFSSPDLSKLNYLADFDRPPLPALGVNATNDSDDLDLSSHSLDESSIVMATSRKCGAANTPTVNELLLQIRANKEQRASLESLNISQQIPNNFNFSACNTSTINLLGAHAAPQPPPLPLTSKGQQPKHMLMDDLSGYCFMAPIKKKLPSPLAASEKEKITAMKAESTSSGYSTRSYSSSSASSCTNSTEEQLTQQRPAAATAAVVQPTAMCTAAAKAEESVIYEEMHIASLESSQHQQQLWLFNATPAPTLNEFTGNLYENLLTIKAARELEQLPNALPTSTPTESPHIEVPARRSLGVPAEEEEESFYQTPRKSIISVDDKIPSYYPNSCESLKVRRPSQSPVASATPSSEKSNGSACLRHFVGVKLRRDRKPEQPTTPPPRDMTSPRAASSNVVTDKAQKALKGNKKSSAGGAAQKIAENVYAVMRSNSSSSSGGSCGSRKSQRKSSKMASQANETATAAYSAAMQKELQHMAILQDIDFKFDDTKALTVTVAASEEQQHEADTAEQENFYQTARRSASRLVEQHVNLMPRHLIHSTTTRKPAKKHHLQANQQANRQSPGDANAAEAAAISGSGSDTAMTQSKLEVPVSSTGGDWRKFASLPRFKKIDFSPLKLKLNNVLQRNQTPSPTPTQHQEY